MENEIAAQNNGAKPTITAQRLVIEAAEQLIAEADARVNAARAVLSSAALQHNTVMDGLRSRLLAAQNVLERVEFEMAKVNARSRRGF